MKSLRIMMMVMLAALVSCERRSLTEPDFKTRVDVQIRVKAIANVTCDVYNSKDRKSVV